MSGGDRKKMGAAPPTFVERARSIGIVTGVTGVVGLFGFQAYEISKWASGLSLADGMYAGVYAGGMVSTAVAVGGFFTIRRFLSIHPEALFTSIMDRLQADPVIKAEMGGMLAPGKFKAYAYSGGFIYRDASTRTGLGDMFGFEPYGCQLMFQVQGSNCSAMVSVRAVQAMLGSVEIRNLAVDFVDGDRIILEGSADDVAYKGIVRLR